MNYKALTCDSTAVNQSFPATKCKEGEPGRTAATKKNEPMGWTT